MNYTITYDDGKVKSSEEFSAPDRLPQPGDIYELTVPIYTLAGECYNVGDLMKIVERTNFAPHHRTSSLGNLIVCCKHFPNGSVWTNIELMIAEGKLRLIGVTRLPCRLVIE